MAEQRANAKKYQVHAHTVSVNNLRAGEMERERKSSAIKFICSLMLAFLPFAHVCVYVCCFRRPNCLKGKVTNTHLDQTRTLFEQCPVHCIDCTQCTRWTNKQAQSSFSFFSTLSSLSRSHTFTIGIACVCANWNRTKSSEQSLKTKN